VSLERPQQRLAAVIVFGGIAVLASYVHGYVTHPDIRWDIWGGIPGALRMLYTVSMLGAAAGFFPFTLFILLRVRPDSVRFPANGGYGAFTLLYALVLAGSAAWSPLTYAMLESPSATMWLAIRVTLGVVAGASLGLLATLLALKQRESATWCRLAVMGCLLFCWQTVVLDAILWPYYFPLQ
jgi:hypothetical protein